MGIGWGVDGQGADQASGLCNWMGRCSHLLRQEIRRGQPGLRTRLEDSRQLEEVQGKYLAIQGRSLGFLPSLQNEEMKAQRGEMTQVTVSPDLVYPEP